MHCLISILFSSTLDTGGRVRSNIGRLPQQGCGRQCGFRQSGQSPIASCQYRFENPHLMICVGWNLWLRLWV